jgi:hypothetical protein
MAATGSHTDEISSLDCVQRTEKCVSVPKHHEVAGLPREAGRRNVARRPAERAVINAFPNHYIQTDAGNF